MALVRKLGDRVSSLVQTHQEFLLLLVLFISTRLSLLLISRPQGYLLDASDYNFYLDMARMSDQGLYPMLQYWVEYPPVFPWIAVGVYRLTEIVPNFQGSPLLWFRLALGSVTLLFDVGNLFLIYALGQTIHHRTGALRIAWSYALLFVPLHVWLAWFDTVPLFFLLLATYLTVKGKRELAALAAGFGFMVKILPILAMPLTLKTQRGLARRAALVVLAALAVLAAAAPFLLLAPQYLIASFRSMFSRAPWETPWAIWESYFGYGAVAPLPTRVDPSTATFSPYTSHLPWPLISAVFAALYLLLWTRRFDAGKPLKAVAFVGLTVNLFMLYSKGYSPQFLLYVVPFALLTIPLWRALAYLIVLSTVNLIEYPVYGVLFNDQHWLLHDLVFLRVTLLLLLSWEYLVALDLLPSWQTVQRLTAVASVMVFVAWAGGSLPAAGSQWATTTLQHRPDASVVDYLNKNTGPGSIVVFTDQGLYRELYPYLYQRASVLLVDPTVWRPAPGGAGGGSTAPVSGLNAVSAQVSALSSHYTRVYLVSNNLDPRGVQLRGLLYESNSLEDYFYSKNLIVSIWSPVKQVRRR